MAFPLDMPPQQIDALYQELAGSLCVSSLGKARRTRVRAQLLARIRAGAAPAGTRTLRAAEGEWREFAPGITIKLLRSDASHDNMTALLRMQPGSTLGSHGHVQSEECLILQGEIFIGSHRLGAGDLHVAPPGTGHAAVSS